MQQPTYALNSCFLGLSNTSPDANIVIAGIQFDYSTSNRPGARFGPDAIRQISRMLVDGANPYNWKDPKLLDVADVGNIPIAHGSIKHSLASIEEHAYRYKHIAALGGDHLVTLPLLRALRRKHKEPIALVHFDAHIDTWPDSFGLEYSHGSVFYHAINEELICPTAMVQLGIRSPLDRSVYDWTVEKGSWILNPEDMLEYGTARLSHMINEKIGKRPAYLSFDIDALDPSYAPGTGTPEVGGLTTYQVLAIIRKLNLNFVGMDLVEVSPAYDHSEITALAGATIVFQYLSNIKN